MIEKGFFSLDIRDYARLEVCVSVYVFWHLCVCVQARLYAWVYIMYMSLRAHTKCL